jgi:hypothetical protein
VASQSDAGRFLAEPDTFFGRSYTERHSVSRERLTELQTEALSIRFDRHRERIPMVAKLADRQGITSIDEIESVVPLLFEHTMYKSYPLVFLERQQFGNLTVWLDKLTAVDLAAFDATACDSIDAWLNRLAAETQLNIGFTGGTTGKMSFFPWTQRDLLNKGLSTRVSALQVFGDPPPTSEEWEEPIHLACPAGRYRVFPLGEVISRGKKEFMHLRDQPLSADMLWLAATLRFAAARGDVTRVEVPESLLARRRELEDVQAGAQAQDEAWLEEVAGLQGEKVIWSGLPYDIYRFSAQLVERGERWSFAPGSVVLLSGGAKGYQLPENWVETIEQAVDARALVGYGMMELTCMNMMCLHGRYHLEPWNIPFVLDPDTSELLPRHGVQIGRAAFFDLLTNDHWGGLITGDEIEIDFDTLCPCGATSAHVGPKVARLGSTRGGDDKISCAATPEAHAEAMDFLTSS